MLHLITTAFTAFTAATFVSAAAIDRGATASDIDSSGYLNTNFHSPLAHDGGSSENAGNGTNVTVSNAASRLSLGVGSLAIVVIAGLF